MPVGLTAPQNILPIKGIKLAATYCGIRKAEKDDLVLIEIAEGSSVAATFTRNAFCAAPVQLAKQHLATAAPRYLLINAGNANAGTGAPGLAAAEESCSALAAVTSCATDQVLPFSTGVIGEYLPVEKIAKALPQLQTQLAEDSWLAAAQGIMTTDTLPKAVSNQVSLSCGTVVTISGISKGAGMICPDMATMLAYVATDAAIAQEELQGLLQELVAESFNSITVDSDTSTNDACVLMATGQAGNAPVTCDSMDGVALKQGLRAVFVELAQAIVRDAEGATKFVSLEVSGGQSVAECKQVAYTIAHSPLVKTALFASDPNWGRILAAIGRAGLQGLDLSAINFSLNGVSIVAEGGRDPAYTEGAGAQAMQQQDISIGIELGRGQAEATVWTCDLSYDYVKINAEYRT